jgi:CHAT domain-containing protein
LGRLAVPLRQWSDFDVIHLACHGSFIAGSPLDATLYLGSEALRASEFFGLRLRSEVVCLSACDVGQQSETLDGLTLVSDEWLGLALPLFQAGTRSLLVSLWRANSEIARTFMQHFHEALAHGLDPARAHQRACLARIRERSRFGFWANWQLAGFPA